MNYKKWNAVAGFEGLYEITRKGIIRSLDKRIDSPHNATRVIKGKILKVYLSNNGYVNIDLTKNKTRYKTKLHRLVATTFINNPENLPEVNHKDGNKQNNYYKNLEWVTRRENINHAYKFGLMFSGEKHHKSKINDNDIKQIRLLSKTHTYSVLGELFNTSKDNIRRYVLKERRKYI